MNKIPNSFRTARGNQVLVHRLSEKSVRLEILIPGKDSEEIIFSDEIHTKTNEGSIAWSWDQHEALITLFQILLTSPN
ncbi:hypothetical protein [Chitinophaga varians]|uniref:hypothetical protein n=1 Tax=Chitinophaga varians TaxID=2202339 RepID=UPI00165F9323|nr:hypothetical protein [Chitinophaga varians]MBC9913512.1 hypothetical protein [Chitinophaga varians]